MHIKKSMFENIFNIVIDVKGKTKDNMKAIMDILLFCYHKNIELIYDGSQVVMSKANFVLDKHAQYLSTNGLRVCIFLMDMLQTYLDWWRIVDCIK
jgi:hypothetical protein